MLLMLPGLIVETGLLSFISRHHLLANSRGSALKEVPLKQTTMLRRLVVMYRDQGYLSAATRRLIELLTSAASRADAAAGG